MRDINFYTFSKSHWWLYILFGGLLILCVSCYICIFYGQIDASSWASLTSGIFTYVGSVILGVFLYYNTWAAQQKELICRVPRISLNLCDIDSNGDYLIPYEYDHIRDKTKFYAKTTDSLNINYEKDYFYIGFTIRNNHPHNILIENNIDSVYYFDGNNFIKQDTQCEIKNTHGSKSLANNTEQEIYIGISNFDVEYKQKTHQQFAYTIRLVDEFHQTYYYIVRIELGKALRMYNPEIITEEAFKIRKNINNGLPFVLTDMELEYAKRR